jgi:methionine-gamma-lyase
MSTAKKISKVKSVGMGDKKSYTMETQLIYGKTSNPKWDYDHQLVPPISSSTTFRLDSAQRGAEGFKQFGCVADKNADISKLPIYIYDRLGEPNKEILEEHLAYAENGESCVTFASGMAAISAVLCVLTKSGEEILSHKTLYGCTFSLMKNWLPRFQISVKFADLINTKNLKNLITEKTRVIYFETPVNPTLELIDICEVRSLVDEINKKRKESNKIHIVVDNTFATPFCQRPIDFGADFVVHSLTKNIGGFGTDMGGAVIGPLKYKPQILLFRKDFGGVLNNKSAWSFLVYGIPTLSLRLMKQQETAIEVAKFLETHSKILMVNYPGLPDFHGYELAKMQMIDYHGNFAPGSMIYFVVKGKTAAARLKNGERLINYLAKNAYTITLAVSLGNIRSLVEHPGSMTHSAIPPEVQLKDGMDPGGIRLSIGLENVNDIINDLKKALKIL